MFRRSLFAVRRAGKSADVQRSRRSRIRCTHDNPLRCFAVRWLLVSHWDRYPMSDAVTTVVTQLATAAFCGRQVPRYAVLQSLFGVPDNIS